MTITHKQLEETKPLIRNDGVQTFVVIRLSNKKLQSRPGGGPRPPRQESNSKHGEVEGSHGTEKV